MKNEKNKGIISSILPFFSIFPLLFIAFFFHMTMAMSPKIKTPPATAVPVITAVVFSPSPKEGEKKNHNLILLVSKILRLNLKFKDSRGAKVRI